MNEIQGPRGRRKNSGELLRVVNLPDLARAAQEREKLKLSQSFGAGEPGGWQRETGGR